MSPTYAVVGGGILGLAVAARLQEVDPDAVVTVLEKEAELATHQTGRNSGVVHAGLYYTPGSLKARLCRRGVGMLREFCQEHGVAYDEIGKVLVALDDTERDRLAAIEERAAPTACPASGGSTRRRAARDRAARAPASPGLHSPATAIADFPGVTRALAAAGRGPRRRGPLSASR